MKRAASRWVSAIARDRCCVRRVRRRRARAPTQGPVLVVPAGRHSGDHQRLRRVLHDRRRRLGAGAARPVPPVIVSGPLITPAPYHTGHYFPYPGTRPGYGRREVEPPAGSAPAASGAELSTASGAPSRSRCRPTIESAPPNRRRTVMSATPQSSDDRVTIAIAADRRDRRPTRRRTAIQRAIARAATDHPRPGGHDDPTFTLDRCARRASAAAAFAGERRLAVLLRRAVRGRRPPPVIVYTALRDAADLCRRSGPGLFRPGHLHQSDGGAAATDAALSLCRRTLSLPAAYRDRRCGTRCSTRSCALTAQRADACRLALATTLTGAVHRYGHLSQAVASRHRARARRHSTR